MAANQEPFDGDTFDADTFTASWTARSAQASPNVSDSRAWAGREWWQGSPARGGSVAFAGQARQGTIMVTPIRRRGIVRVDLQFADPRDGYVQITAEVREGWLRDTATAGTGTLSYERIADALLEIAALPNQRTVRVGRVRLSA